ncbi:MAG: dockerin type I domain-containing protein [Candidatus Zixiibacteriota bacterium]
MMEGTSIKLHWTAPGDDGPIGRASLYEIRCSTKNCGLDTLSWWNKAVVCPGVPTPGPSGYADSFTIIGLEPDSTYYIAIRAADDAGNWSEVSNIYSNAYFICADANSDNNINLMDVIFLLIFLYRHGPAPDQLASCDINSDNSINLMDVTYLMNYLYKGGPPPICN